jgi:Cu-Zn family superoxide dismutase
MKGRRFGKERIGVTMAFLLVVVGILSSSGAATAGDPPGLAADVRDASGNIIGKVKFNPTDDGKVLVKVSITGLSPGFHGFHVHGVATCDAAATDPSTGSPSPFLTAGGHHNPGGASHGAHDGDMPPLLVNQDRTAQARFETDRLSIVSLMDLDGSAVIVHAGADNLANIPAGTTTTPRYHSHTETDTAFMFGADRATRATGDAGARFGCGIVRSVSD